MQYDKTPYPLHCPSGEMRHVGFEIEYIDFSLENSVTMIQNLFDGSVTQKNDHLYHVNTDDYGTFSVERDLHLLQSLSEQSKANQEQGKIDVEGTINTVMTELLKNLVPIEIVTPPLLFSDAGLMTSIVDELKKTSASDTSKNLLTAFGLHINPELPDLDTRTITKYLKAYALLNPWLRHEINVDVSRRLSPFIDEYPATYIKLILNQDYKPDQTALIDDYLKHNNTRNRSLDMLPLFKHLDEERVTSSVPKENIKARPTFHYRLPNTSFRKESWDVQDEWERWLMVEKLANSESILFEMSKCYVEHVETNLLPNTNAWIETTLCFIEKLKK